MSSFSWGDLLAPESLPVVGSDAVVVAGVVEEEPRDATVKGGSTLQRVSLLWDGPGRLDPPMRLMIRGAEHRVLGTQSAPWVGTPSLVTCERINPDLPDDLTLFRVVDGYDRETNKKTSVETVVWAGPCHVSSGDPRITETVGELAPLNRVTITCDTGISGADLDGLWARVTHTVTPAVGGAPYKLVGEALESTSQLRRFVAERKGAL